MPADHNPNSVPFGNGTLTISAATFKVNDPGDSPNESTHQVIHEPDESGKAQPGRYAVIDGGDLLTRTVVVQRVNSSTAAAERGDSVSYDHDRSGTASSWTVANVSTPRGATAIDTYSLELILDTYQG